MKTGMQKYTEMCIIKIALAKYQVDMKINRNITETEKKKKEIRKKEKWYQGNKKGYYKQKYRLTRNK